MKAIDFELGCRFENVDIGDTIIVVRDNHEMYFENECTGELYDSVDEDLYIELGE